MRGMSCRLTLLFSLLFIISNISLQEEVIVSIQSVTTIAKTDSNFICATLDWWPPEKCNYNMCPWGNSSIINHLTPKDGKLQSRVVLLNGQQLQLTGTKNIPKINPISPGLHPPAIVQIFPLSIVFVRYKDFRAPACPSQWVSSSPRPNRMKFGSVLLVLFWSGIL